MTPKPDWRDLAEQASVEMDSNRLGALVEELNRALDEQEALRTKRRNPVLLVPLPATVEPLAS